MSKRTDRVNMLLRQELSQLIQRELKDPRLEGGMVSVTEVSATRDLNYATVYVSHLGTDDELGEVMAALRGSAGYLRNALRSRVHLRQIPVLKFEFDPSIERGARLTSVIENLQPPSADG